MKKNSYFNKNLHLVYSLFFGCLLCTGLGIVLDNYFLIKPILSISCPLLYIITYLYKIIRQTL